MADHVPFPPSEPAGAAAPAITISSTPDALAELVRRRRVGTVDRTREPKEQRQHVVATVLEFAFERSSPAIELRPELADAIALALFYRRTTDAQRIERLLEQPDLPAGALYLELAMRRDTAVQRLPRFLRSTELRDRLAATAAVELLGSPRDAELVWDNISFHDPRHYLDDLRLRHASLVALIQVELNRIVGARPEPSW